MSKLNTDGWDDLGDRLDILWGPDYLGRYDFYLFQGKETKGCFAQIPDDIDLPIVDKRNEIESFDVKKGVGSIEVTNVSHPFTEAYKE